MRRSKPNDSIVIAVLVAGLALAACGGSGHKSKGSAGSGGGDGGSGGVGVPVAQDLTVITREDIPVALTLTGTDPGGSALTYSLVTQPAHGTLSGTPPNLYFVPNSNFNGADGFSYSVTAAAQQSAPAFVTLQVDPVNDRPVADDQSRAVAENQPLSLTLTGSDVEGSPLTFTVANGPYNGVLTGTAPNLTYTPNSLFNGVDFFTFHGNDGTDPSNAASVLISVYDPAAPADVTGFQATGSDGQIALTWSNPSDADLRGVRIRRRSDTFPTSATDGTLVYDAPNGLTSFTDVGLANGSTYYYKAFAFDDAGKFAAGVNASDQPHSPFTLQDVQKHASDAQASDVFGTSVAISGDYAIAGASGKASSTGAAYIFHRNSVTGAWDTGTKVVASDAQTADEFGYTVSISGDYAIVGAYTKASNAGAAYIFHRTGTNTWDAGTKIVASDAQAGDDFGISVSISGDYAIVGALGESGGPGDPLPVAGAAYLYRRTGSNTWDGGTKIVAADAAVFDQFGISTAISGDYAVVGANAKSTSTGAAYVFHRTGANAWDAGTTIVASDAQTGDLFGAAVAISGDYVIVGALHEDGGAGDPISNAGAGYIFHRTGTNIWSAGTKIAAPDAQANDLFGWSVGISGTYAIVGAYRTGPVAGSAYLFHLIDSNTWSGGTKIGASDAQPNDEFGWTVAISGASAIIGANTEDGGPGDPLPDSGAAYIFR